MKSVKVQSTHQEYLNKLKLIAKNRYISGLLILSAVFIPASIALQAKSTLAQSVIAQSLSLDKNVIYVNPKSGDDSQLGKKTAPLKTITQALKIATFGTTIKLSSGTYNEEAGETFPLIIKNQITIVGNTKTQGHNIVIKGGGDFVSPTGAGQNVAIAALKDAGGVLGVTVTNDHSRGHGLWIESSSPKVVSNTFTRSGNTGVSVNGKSSPVIEDNYFYNNSGNGLLVYGTSQPQIVKNTFEQTGFGVSAVQDTALTLTSNYFDSNRIGIILEGNSQATLRDNEIINSGETGLTAIANSQVDLGTNDKPGNNTFRSNKKLDIQNATSNEIVAVGTETSGGTEGNINFESGEFIANADSERNTPLALAPLNDRPAPKLTIPAPAPTQTETSSLPSPPPVPVERKNNNKELVFTASSNSVDDAPEPEPVPFLPQTSNSAIGSSNSQISSLSDVLGSSNVAVKYKVLVETEDEYDLDEVRSLYPQAFTTVYQGKSVLQVGAFNNWDKAKQAERSLEDLGLDTHILE